MLIYDSQYGNTAKIAHAAGDGLSEVIGAAGSVEVVKVAAFDTRTDPDKVEGSLRVFAKILDRFGYAAPKISSSLEKNGGQVIKPPEGFYVKGTEGPLEEGELERAKDWAGQIAASW